jgi:hypothetical protein
MNIISLGAGVQSSVMALMAAHGEIEPRPDCAIFADTHAEPKAVYDWLDWLETVVSNPLRVEYPFKVIRVTFRSLRTDIGKIYPKGPSVPIPAFVLRKSETGGWYKNGLIQRRCTGDYKIKPVVREIRKQLGIYKKRTPPGILVDQWMGISTNEAQRMKPSRESFIRHRWPLIEKGMNRWDCIRWMQKHYDLTPPRSACTFCPFHSNEEWRNLKENYPEDFADAVKVDSEIRGMYYMGEESEAGEFYLHSSCVPLADAELDDNPDQPDMFGNECEGMCGV